MHVTPSSWKWTHQHHAHAISLHDAKMHVNMLLHDSRFWAAFALVAFLAIMITIAILTAGSPAVTDGFMNYYPYGMGL